VKRVLIDATIVRAGGPVTYLRNLLPALLRQAGDYTYALLLSSRYQQHLRADIPPGIEVVSVSVPSQPLLRWLRLQTLIPGLVRTGAFDVVFSVAEISAVRPPCPHVALVRNHHLYAPLRSYPQLGQRLRLGVYRTPAGPGVAPGAGSVGLAVAHQP
jgi:hypothetical protein